jgi:hypothetical protein
MMATKNVGSSVHDQSMPDHHDSTDDKQTKVGPPFLPRLRRDPEGIFHLGDDGVLRSINGDRSIVLDYRRLSPQEIKNVAAPFDQAKKDKLVDVDGRDIIDEKALWAVPEGVPERESRESSVSGVGSSKMCKPDGDDDNLAAETPLEEAREAENKVHPHATLRKDPEGILHLGADGVLRSLNHDRTVVLDYRRLSPEEAREIALPFGQETLDALIGVDGRDVVDDELLWAVPEVKSVYDESKLYKRRETS